MIRSVNRWKQEGIKAKLQEVFQAEETNENWPNQRNEQNLKNITFAPVLNKDQVQNVLSMSDLLVSSVRDESLYNYGMSPNKFIDYMYAKKPVVCLFSGYQSMLNEADCGEFIASEDSVALANSIEKYLSLEASEISRIGNNGYKFLLEKRNYDFLSEKYLKLCE